MNGTEEGGARNRDTIERELRLLATVRRAYRERGGALPSIDQMDALLDELIEVNGRGKHRRDNAIADAKPSLWH